MIPHRAIWHTDDVLVTDSYDRIGTTLADAIRRWLTEHHIPDDVPLDASWPAPFPDAVLAEPGAHECPTCGHDPNAELREQYSTTDAGVVYPFVEDEVCNVTGFGHQPKAAFAEAVNRWDRVVGGVELADGNAGWTAAHVSHKWALAFEDEHFWNRDPRTGEPITGATPGAFPITTLWGQR
ncbi:hypothetical protein INN71_02650 [Nocardioides sp. ChNu-153]|uniref:hypothetical protein n=1 Tax=unclassified Nocardioides TaxID=2615069 RepID=UPI00240616C2|nr:MULTISPECIES: hypothetical protein [unclassified Nocardioides]MDF9718071.1 hypothetical protein [Nocardioides sp. ChNu-99]MDN7120285.1 hypothetical protein [Nocardioides sp. ChNu-153]